MGQPRLHSSGKPRNPPHRVAPPVGRVGRPPRGRVPTPTRRKNTVGAGFAASGSCRKPLAPLPHCPETYTPPGTEHTHTSAVCVPLSLGGSSRRVGQVGQEQKRKVKVKRKSFGKPSASLLALPHSFAPPGSSRWVSGARQPTLFGCASAESSLRSATLARRFRAGSRLATAPAAEKAGSPRAVATSSCDAALQSEELQRLAA